MNHTKHLLFTYIILLNLFIPQIAFAAPPTQYKEVDSDISLRGAIFANDSSGLYASYIDGNIQIVSDGTGAHVRELRFKDTALKNRLAGYNGYSVGVTHISDDGTVSHYVDTLEIDSQGFAYGTYEFSEVIISGLTGTTTFSGTGLSGNYTKSFNEVNVSYIDFNITNHDSSLWSSTDGRNYQNKSIITINGSMVTNESNIPLQLFINLEGVNGTGDIGVAYKNLTAIPREIEYVWDDDNVSLYLPSDTFSGVDSEFVVLWGSDNNTEPAAGSTYGSQAVWDGNYVGVWHMNNDPSGAAPQLLDSTANGNNGTSEGGMTSDDLVDGDYGKGIDFDGVNDRFIVPHSSELSITTGFTILSILEPITIDATWRPVYGKGAADADENYFHAYKSDVTYFDWSGYTQSNTVYTTVRTIGVQTYDGSSVGKQYINNAQLAESVGATIAAATNVDVLEIGSSRNGLLFNNFKLYELRIQKIEQSLNYRTTVYKNLNNPIATGTAPFYKSFSSPQSPSADLNITTSVTGDTNITNYTTDIPQTHTLTPTANISQIVFNTTSTNWDYTAILYWTNDATLTETATNGEYHANVIAIVPLSLDNGTLNYTITNTILLNADFSNYIQLSTNDSNFNESASDLILPDISLVTTATSGMYYYDLQYDYFYPPQNLTAEPDIDHVNLNWTATPNADKYSVYELTEGIPWFDTVPVLDGAIDSIYTELSHNFRIVSPNPTSPTLETFLLGRDATYIYGSGIAFDDDSQTTDDYVELYIDFTNDGLTADDLAYKLTENGVASRMRYTGSVWAAYGGSGVIGTTTGAGTGTIGYEFRIPISELPPAWVSGATVTMLLERECTSTNPDIESFYPAGNVNNTDTSLWQEIKLTNASEYTWVADTTNTSYIAEDLIFHNWNRFAVSAHSGSQETSYTTVDVTTLDIPSYTISGYILSNETGSGILGANVWLTNGYVSAITTTNAAGYYTIDHVHNGTFTVNASATGYYSNNTTAFSVLGANVSKNISLTRNLQTLITFLDISEGSDMEFSFYAANGALVAVMLSNGSSHALTGGAYVVQVMPAVGGYSGNPLWFLDIIIVALPVMFGIILVLTGAVALWLLGKKIMEVRI